MFRNLTESVRKNIFVGITTFVCLALFFIKPDLSFDILLLFLFLLVVIYARSKSFVKDWSPMVQYYYFYEFSQRNLTIIQQTLHISINNTLLYDVDKFLFGPQIPVLIAQQFVFEQPTILDYISYLWYTSFFILPIAAGYYLWVKNREFSLLYRNAMVILCFTALITFLVFPAAPPWMASELGIIPPVTFRPWSRLSIGELTLGLYSQVGVNPVAPFPSLHTGWAVLTAYMLSTFARINHKKWGILWYIYPTIMCLVITYTADHYVIDMLGGIAYTVISIIAATYLQKRLHQQLVSSLS